ncbi:MAG: hypothetical protein AAFN11_04220 [Chloroflexota bacterium]
MALSKQEVVDLLERNPLTAGQINIYKMLYEDGGTVTAQSWQTASLVGISVR